MHVGCSAEAPGPEWVETVVFMVLWVWLLWEQIFSQQGSLTTGHASDLRTHRRQVLGLVLIQRSKILSAFKVKTNNYIW